MNEFKQLQLLLKYKQQASFIRTLSGLFMGITWIMGFVLAKGFWSTFFCCMPFWAWYIVVEHFLKLYKLI